MPEQKDQAAGADRHRLMVPVVMAEIEPGGWSGYDFPHGALASWRFDSVLWRTLAAIMVVSRLACHFLANSPHGSTLPA
jgi:hypothetical protein